MDFVSIIMIIFFTIVGTCYYLENKKYDENKELSHTDSNGIYWKYISYGKHGGLYFIDTSSITQAIIYDKYNEFDTLTANIKKIYFNGDISKIVVNNLNQSITGYDIMKFYFVSASSRLTTSPGVFFAGGITYDFNGREINRINDLNNIPSFGDFKAIEYDSDLKEIYDFVSREWSNYYKYKNPIERKFKK